MIAWVVQNMKRSRRLAEVIVATDDERIAEAAREAGAEVAMPEGDFATGTDRVHAAVEGRDADVVVNVQGDEPLLPADHVDRLVEPFDADGELSMATLAARFDRWDEVENPRTAKVVVDDAGRALYFSRAPIPHCYRPESEESAAPPAGYLRHIGVYAYRRDFLGRLAETPPCPLEQMERLEQLRALWMGARIAVVEVSAPTIGVDTPEDLAEVENILLQKSAGAAVEG